MTGSTITHLPEAVRLAAHRGERAVYALLALAMLGTLIPVGPAIPRAERAAVAATCPGPVPSLTGSVGIPCIIGDGIAMAAPAAALRVAALMVH